MTKRSVKYMHLVNNQPAYFDGSQLVRPSPRGLVRQLAGSVAQIRREQRASRAFRERHGCAAFDRRHPVAYGYVKVFV